MALLITHYQSMPNHYTRSIGFKLVSLLLMIVALAGCSEPLHKQQRYVFSTLAEVIVYDEDGAKAKDATDEVLKEFDRLERMLHTWKPSELSQLNTAFTNKQSMNISPELSQIIIDATRRAQQSGNRFNPATGKIIEQWGFHANDIKPVIPSTAVIATWIKANPRMDDIHIQNGSIESTNPSVQLDLDGYTAGYALDRARRLLIDRGIKNALISIGNNVIALGEKGGRPWKIGIPHPRKPGPIATLELNSGESISTVGDYQRFFERDGKRYCDIINAATGYPVQTTQAVSVISKPSDLSATSANVAARSLFIAGPTEWRETAQRMTTDMAMLIDDKGEVRITEMLSRRVEFKLPKPVIHETR